AELTELVWMPLSDAKRLDMPAVTGVMLEELDGRVANGLGHDLPVPVYRMIRGSFLRELLLSPSMAGFLTLQAETPGFAKHCATRGFEPWRRPPPLRSSSCRAPTPASIT